MKWKFRGDRPIYAQLIEQLQRGILTGEYPPGSAVPSVRTLAIEAEVNPNTMQKALAELETQGLMQTHRTAGRTVTEDSKMIDCLKENLAREQVDAFFEGMKSIGISASEAVRIIVAAAAVRESGAAAVGSGAGAPVVNEAAPQDDGNQARATEEVM